MSKTRDILSEDLIFSLIDHITEMVIGMEKIIGIYTHPETDELCGITLQYRNNRLQEHELNLTNVKDQLTKLRLENSKYRWLDKSQVPFDASYDDKSQLNIFDEYNHLILLIALPGIKHSEKSILLIYFKDDINAFGIQHHRSSLSTETKSIIAHLLSGSIHSFCKLYWREKAKFEQFTQKTHRILQQQRADIKNDTRIEELEEVLLSWSRTYLLECSNSDGFNYVYSDGAIEKIKNYKGEFKSLQKAIQEAVEYTKIVVTDVTKEIQSEFIEFNTNVNNAIEDSLHDTTELSFRLQRVYEFLDRLELAGRKVDQMGQNLTGTNIGNAIEHKPISAAAISDYIGKNRDRINTLFTKFPDKWSFIKNNFKSIINVTAQSNKQLNNWIKTS